MNFSCEFDILGYYLAANMEQKHEAFMLLHIQHILYARNGDFINGFIYADISIHSLHTNIAIT